MDAITIERACRNDRSAQEALLRNLQDVWFRVCRSMLQDHDLARDATQETGLRFLRDLPRFRRDSSITTWSIGIAINVVREMRRARQANDVDRTQLAAVRRPASGPESGLLQSEQDALMRSALLNLSERQREAIVLRFFEDLSTEETAAAMNCAVGTVKATVHQALRILRRQLTQLT